LLKLSVNVAESLRDSLKRGSIVNKVKDEDSVLYQRLNVEEDTKFGKS
jgi:hypothetical protein